MANRGRKPLAPEVRSAIAAMHAEHPEWSNRRMAAELGGVGLIASPAVVGKYRRGGTPRRPGDGIAARRRPFVAHVEQIDDDDTWVANVETSDGSDILPGADYINIFVDGEANARWLAGSIVRTLANRRRRERS